MPEILKEWVGYNNKTTEEKKPDGTVKKTKHNKIWAAALTDTGHVYVRYGPAKQPPKLTEQIIRPKPSLTSYEALLEAEHIFQEKVDEKLRKGYETIPFQAPPHYVSSFSRWRMSNEPETAIAPVSSVAGEQASHTDERIGKTSLRFYLEHLEESLLEAPCPWCATLHARYLIDVGNGQLYAPERIVTSLEASEEGRLWLASPCVREGDQLRHQETKQVLALVVDLAADGVPECVFKEQ
jgi:hypothetical protein